MADAPGDYNFIIIIIILTRPISGTTVPEYIRRLRVSYDGDHFTAAVFCIIIIIIIMQADVVLFIHRERLPRYIPIQLFLTRYDHIGTATDRI